MVIFVLFSLVTWEKILSTSSSTKESLHWSNTKFIYLLETNNYPAHSINLWKQNTKSSLCTHFSSKRSMCEAPNRTTFIKHGVPEHQRSKGHPVCIWKINQTPSVSSDPWKSNVPSTHADKETIVISATARQHIIHVSVCMCLCLLLK